MQGSLLVVLDLFCGHRTFMFSASRSQRDKDNTWDVIKSNCRQPVMLQPSLVLCSQESEVGRLAPVVLFGPNCPGLEIAKIVEAVGLSLHAITIHSLNLYSGTVLWLICQLHHFPSLRHLRDNNNKKSRKCNK
jgi:hypothetical protein